MWTGNQKRPAFANDKQELYQIPLPTTWNHPWTIFWFFFFFKIYFIVHLFVCVPSEARRHPIPRSWSYKWLWTNQSGCWEPDLGPPLLPAEPSLQPCIFFLHTFLEKHMYMFITRTEEMAQLLRTQTALPGDWSLIPNTPISWLTTTFNSSGFHRP